MADSAPATTYVVDAPLPWPDRDALELTHGAFEPAAIVGGSGRRECRVRKIAAQGATISGAASSTAPGDEMSLELGTGQRHQCTVEWAKGGEVGLKFGKPIDIIALINRNLVAQPVERRRMPRVELRWPVHIKWSENLVPATIRNISSSGIQVEGQQLPPPDTLASIYVDGLALPSAEVVWRQDGTAGFEFFEEVSWASLIAWVRDTSRQSLFLS